LNSAPASPERSPLGALRLRFRLLEIGLLLPVLITIVVGVGYLRAVRARQEAVEAAGRQISRGILDWTMVDASRRGDAAAHAILDPIARLAHPTAAGALAAMQRATDSLRSCRCGPLKEGSYFFVWVPPDGEFTISVPTTPEDDPRLRFPPHFNAANRTLGQIWGMGGVTASGPWLLHSTVIQLAGGARAVVGFDISMSSWWEGTLRPALSAAERQFFPMLADTDTGFAAVFLGHQLEIARTGGSYDGPTAEIPLQVFPDFSMRVALNPTILPLVLPAANLPGSLLPVVAIVASLLASAVALVLLRQVRVTIAQREAFVAGISHELRTPLTEVLLHAESLHLDRHTPEAKGRAAASIVRETRRLIGLVENALTLAGAGRVDRQATGPSLAAEVIEASLRSLEPALLDRGVQLEVALAPDLRCQIDPVSLDRIVVNLVENALRYGPPGQRIRVRLERQSNAVRLVVEDEGPGVPVEERTRIWRPFLRGTAARNGAGSGVGLGLSIVEHLTVAAGGTVLVDDAPGGGARFSVTLPAVASQDVRV